MRAIRLAVVVSACGLLAALGAGAPLAQAAPVPGLAPVIWAGSAARPTLAAREAFAPPAIPVSRAARREPAPFVIIMMENHGLRPVLNDRTDMPYLNSLWRGHVSRDFTSYTVLAHPSLPNYLGMTSGFTQATSDAVRPGKFAGPTIWDQLAGAGVSWGVFEEGMPSACYPGISYNDPVTNGQYLLRHDPAIAYDTVYHSAECQQVQPLTALDYTNLPAVSFITPNACDDMHGLTADQLTGTGFVNCLKSSGALEQRSDQWLSQIVPSLTAAGATVFVAFDECCAAALGPEYAIETGPGVTRGSDSTPYSHYSVLAAIEDAYGLPLLGGAATATPLPLP